MLFSKLRKISKKNKREKKKKEKIEAKEALKLQKKAEAEEKRPKGLNDFTDYTLLSPTASDKDVERLCNVAYKNKYYAVCVNPCKVRYAKNYIVSELKSDIKVCSVVGFPLGENLTEIKANEAKRAIADGADEIDMVMSISKAMEGDWSYVKNDISRVVRISRGKIVKVIIEATFLTKEQIEKATKICMKAKADFVKTSTGFAGGGATPEIVQIIAAAAEGKIGIKAAGGIATKEQANDLLRAGATRIGTSRIL